jgi:anthranilate synthase component 1
MHFDEKMPRSDSIARGNIKTISKNIETGLTPIEIFQKFNRPYNAKNMILLETTDIESVSRVDKHSKSILMLQGAIRIECNGQKVQLNALTINGNHALGQIFNEVKPKGLKVTLDDQAELHQLLLTYPHQHEVQDEDSKLKRLSPIDILRSIRNAFISDANNEYSIFLAGLFSYDLIATYENLPKVTEGKNTCPDFVFYLAESILLVDHLRNKKRYLCNHFNTNLVSTDELQKTYFELSRSFEEFESKLKQANELNELTESNVNLDNEFSVDVSDTDYQESVKLLKKNIVDGDVFQVVPSRTFSLACTSPVESYKALKHTNPSPYLFYMQDQDFTIFGASPESALKYTKATNFVELYPIAGTRPRGKKINGEIDYDLDIRIEAELKLDSKEISEHMMLVDLARNDIARISAPGTITVTKLLEVDRYSQVMHLVSNVQGELKTELDALHAYQACMNMGTLTGAPKLKATELLRKVEGTRRGSYGGAVGYLNANGDMDTCIVIRSAFCKNGMAHIQAGAGIVYDSLPELESQETTQKAMAVIKAIQMANQLGGAA